MGSKPSVPSVSDDDLLEHSLHTTPAAQIPIIYSHAYNIGFWKLENLHPFDSKVREHTHTKQIEQHSTRHKKYDNMSIQQEQQN